jgi:dTDP-4-dehydrorhamnose 3,5-epimerase
MPIHTQWIPGRPRLGPHPDNPSLSRVKKVWTLGTWRGCSSDACCDSVTVSQMMGDSPELEGLFVIEPKVFEDDRGYFFESWNERVFQELTGEISFVQDNHSGSRRHVLRGLHYQLRPHAQGKLVRVVRGSIFDVAVDLRKSSPTFRDWFGIELSADNRKQLWIPPGYAHGFVALSDWAEVLYKASGYYSAEHDRSIRWDDPDIGIEWPIDGQPTISDKDDSAPLLRNAELFA